jgi:hypothetical protein
MLVSVVIHSVIVDGSVIDSLLSALVAIADRFALSSLLLDVIVHSAELTVLVGNPEIMVAMTEVFLHLSSCLLLAVREKRGGLVFGEHWLVSGFQMVSLFLQTSMHVPSERSAY